MAPRRKPRTFALMKAEPRIGFTPELQRVLDAAARSVARELGKEAAREAFMRMTGRKVS